VHSPERPNNFIEGVCAMRQSDSFVEEIMETLIPLVTIAGICLSVISLADHLNQTNVVRSDAASGTSVEVSHLSSGAVDAAHPTSHLN
jgi:hypothetical protein